MAVIFGRMVLLFFHLFNSISLFFILYLLSVLLLQRIVSHVFIASPTLLNMGRYLLKNQLIKLKEFFRHHGNQL